MIVVNPRAETDSETTIQDNQRLNQAHMMQRKSLTDLLFVIIKLLSIKISPRLSKCQWQCKFSRETKENGQL